MITRFAISGSAKNFDSRVECPEISKFLKALGMVETSIEDCEGLIFLNYNKKTYKKYKRLGKNMNNLVLIRIEPVSIFPSQYKRSIEQKFKLIINPGKKLNASQNKSDYVGWPYKYNLNPGVPKQNDPDLNYAIGNALANKVFNVESWNKKSNKIVFIAANKVSPTSKSNYKIRRRIVKKMGQDEIDVYGDLWKSSISKKVYHRLSVCLFSLKSGYFPNFIEIYGNLFTKYKTIIGVIPNKHSIIQKYKFSLVIENSSDYCSEKLFDAIINGSIPIYVGPKNDQIQLPNNLYYWSSGSINEIRNFISTLNSKQVSDMLKAMENFIQSKIFSNYWTSEKVYFQISEKVYNFWNFK